MKREKISEAMGNISSRHIKEAAEFTAEEKPHRNKNVWMKWALVAACFCLIVVAAFAFIPMLNNGNGNGDEIIDNVLPTDIDKIIWSNLPGPGGDSDNGFSVWNGFSVDTLLYDALQNYSDEYIAVIMTRANGQKIEETEYNEILAKNISRAYKNGNLYIFVTRDQFLNWGLEIKSDYIFYLASRSSYEGTA